jgi:hypothetical protein
MQMKAIKQLKLSWAAALVGGMISTFAVSPAQAGPTLNFGQQGSMTFTYGLQAWYRYISYDAPNEPNASDFYDRRDRLAVSGQYNDFVGYYFQLEGGGDPGTTRNVFVRDAYVTFDYSDGLRFIVGKFKNTFTRENLEACLEPLTMDRSTLLSYTPWGGTRDDGVAVWGNLLNAKLQYRFMISNGRDDSYTPKHSPRYTARVHVSLWDPEYNYGYLGTYLGTSKVLTFGASYDTQPDVVYADYPLRSDPKSYKAWTTDAFMEYPAASGVYTLSAAYMKYDTGNAINQTPDPAFPVNADLKGYYVKGGYMLPNKVGPGRLQFFARHERADYGIKIGSANYYDQTRDGVGANYYLDGQNLKISAEYTNIRFDTPDPAVPQLQDYKQFIIGLQLII